MKKKVSHERPSFANKIWGRPARAVSSLRQKSEIADLALSIFNYTEKSQRRMPILDASFSYHNGNRTLKLKLCMAFDKVHAQFNLQINIRT